MVETNQKEGKTSVTRIVGVFVFAVNAAGLFGKLIKWKSHR
jgi:hypothetical protein